MSLRQASFLSAAHPRALRVLEAHLRLGRPLSGNDHTCKKCGFTAPEEAYYLSTVRRTGSKARQRNCPDCDYERNRRTEAPSQFGMYGRLVVPVPERAVALLINIMPPPPRQRQRVSALQAARAEIERICEGLDVEVVSLDIRENPDAR